MNGVRTRTTGVVFSFVMLFSVSLSDAVTVSSVSALQNAVSAANSGGDKNIVISSSASPYNLDGVYLRLTADGITVTGSTGNRGDVVLDGGYVTTEIFQIVSSDITIKDLTLQRAYHHPIHIFPETEDVVGTVIENVHIVDPGQQAIKINQDSGKNYSVNQGTVRNSRIELTAEGRQWVLDINNSCYTGGVDAHHAADWIIRNNVVTGFWCGADYLSEHGIHFWSSSQDTVVEKNKIINCDRGIGFGLGSSKHIRGIIRNNMIYHDTGHEDSDVGIGLESASSVEVYNNTIYLEHGYHNAIEFRFSATSGGFIKNNLTNRAITSREGGTASLSNNVTSASSTYFKDSSSGDLHLAHRVSAVVNNGADIAGLTDDYDGEPRPQGGRNDIGADEIAGGSRSSETVISPVMLLLDN